MKSLSLLFLVLLGLLFFSTPSLATEEGVEVEVEESESVSEGVETEVGIPGFRESIAQQLRYYSQSTYCSVDSVSKWSCPVCKQGSLTNFKLTHRFFDPYTNTFGFAGLAPAAGENVIIFSFRGATPSAGRNWITDMNGKRIPYPGLRGATVHQGFYNSYLSIARQVNLAAKSLLANCQHCHIYVTGHSFGGAIATLAAADLFSLSPDLTLYTFGSPRVGDLAFATYFDKIVPDTYRIVHHQDLVPHIPQRFLGFRHVSREVWYYEETGQHYKLCNGGEDDACSNSVNLHVDENSIKDHAFYLDQPMGCRRSDLSQQGLISLLEEDSNIEYVPSSPISKLQSLVELDSAVHATAEAEAETESESEVEIESPSVEEALLAEEDAKRQRLELSGGVEVFPARVLNPLSKPDIIHANNAFHKIQSGWSKLPLSFNPKVKEETEEDRWNRKYPEPK